MSEIILQIEKPLQGAQGGFTLDINTRIESGSLTALFGASGAGKTSILRILSGLDKARGSIRVGGELWLDSESKLCLPPQKRGVGFVFQHYALFPHLNVFENICFGLPRTRNRAESAHHKAFALELVERMGLTALIKARVWNLSGGQQQRVALARALAHRPKILLLDEPFSALDSSLRESLHKELLEIHATFGLTTLLVSHSVGEVFALASNVLELKEGKIARAGTPLELFSQGGACGAGLLAEVVAISKAPAHTRLTLLHNGALLTILHPPSTPLPSLGAQVVLNASLHSPSAKILAPHRIL